VAPELGVEVGALEGCADGVGLGALGADVGVVMLDGCRTGVPSREAPWVPATAPRLVPLALELPSRVEIGLPRTLSSPVTEPRLSARTAAADRAIVCQRGRGCPSGTGSPMITGWSARVAALGVQRVAVRRTASRLRCSEAPYIEPATVAITLATAAPAIVPATPRKEEANAAEAAASALAAICVRVMVGWGPLSGGEAGMGSSGSGCCPLWNAPHRTAVSFPPRDPAHAELSVRGRPDPGRRVPR
jgi:hypothetical protein